MTTPDERAEERDRQKHETEHPGCDARYWRERALDAEKAIVRAVADEQQACIEAIERAGDKQPASVSTVRRAVTFIRARQGRNKQ